MLPGRRHDISRLEAFSDAVFMPLPMFSGFSYFLMGPAHWTFGVSAGRRRTAIESRLAPATV
jgi:hypothetical protein